MHYIYIYDHVGYIDLKSVLINSIFFLSLGKGFKPKAGIDSLPASDDDRETADNWSTASVLSDEGGSSIPSEDGEQLVI